ncbi:MAG: hydroxymethylpyrimidine/phosphomethylpyrimidine kinase [Gammaproteobacteria bacterium]|nr:hydroxymethylpyrimidine/phosphomethylpyrimidine kinase [Gammaproteobacteria bacterium]MBU1656395.1 hydroxymethylpyrimidine/phosphomethylpyrimidine kinase [Gammaproteobacteria bacterium]MBU1960943.1 hydroxymethylpyrimidine/phosphomethylpyrimidine kinase [Gammaproteobacteria bacterium]
MSETEERSFADTPVLLAVGGHDPCGGAGIQADIETAAALGVHAVTAITCLTIQDTGNVHGMEPTPPRLLRRQIEALRADIPIDCCKIGLIGSIEVAWVLAELLGAPDSPPLVLDPVLAAGGGANLSGQGLIETIRRVLIPLCQLLTPNLPEARTLSGRSAPGDCAAELTRLGCAHVLVTGGHEETDRVVNRLYDANGLLNEWEWPRLPHGYHGSGCTLASAVAALLGKGIDLANAVEQAQQFTWRTLADAMQLGRGQLIPKRLDIH